MNLTALSLYRAKRSVPSVPTTAERLHAWQHQRPRDWRDDGPDRDPLDVAVVAAAHRLAEGLPLDAYDWEALKAKATSELIEHDNEARF